MGKGNVVSFPYSSAKATRLHRSFNDPGALEWGGRGVRVNAVCPAWVKTEMLTADQAGGSYSDSDIISRVPMAPFATPDDVARAILFLADSAESGFVNRHGLWVAGGWTAVSS